MNNLVPDALEFYDKNQEKYSSLFDKVGYIRLERLKNDLEHNKIHFYDENKKELFVSRYEIIGVYNNRSRTWSWSWSIPDLDKNTTNIARKIINYGMELNYEQNYFLKTELILSRFRITDQVQLDMHKAIASYLSKKPLVYEYVTYITYEPGQDNLVDVKYEPINNNDKDNKSIYYMFLLDHDKLNQ